VDNNINMANNVNAQYLTEFCIEKKQQQILNIIRQRGNGGYCSK
jgi:hypothetical protein